MTNPFNRARVLWARVGAWRRVGVRTIRFWWLLTAFLSGIAFAMFAEELVLSTEENRLEFSAPSVHFLTGRPLERLHNAAEVPFDFHVTVWAGSRARTFNESAARFVISYDLWEESFAVTRVDGPRRRVSHLSANEAEAWCLKEMAIDLDGLAATTPIWAQMEIRANDGDGSRGLFGPAEIGESGISLTGLIEIFSRPPAREQRNWTLEAGPITLEQLRQRGA